MIFPAEPPTGPARRSGVERREVIVDGWRVEVEVESERRASPPRPGEPRPRRRPPGRADRGPCHHPGCGRLRLGRRRRCDRGRPAAARGGGDEDAERAPRPPGRDGRTGRRRRGPDHRGRRPHAGHRVTRPSDGRGGRRTRAATAGARRSGPRPSRAPRNAATRSRPPRASSFATSTPRPTSPASTRTATSGVPASIRSPAASSRRCTAAGSGRCASTPASRPPRRPIAGSATSWNRARPGCRWPSTCRPRWATTRTPGRPKGRSGGSACPSRAWPTWPSWSTACRSASVSTSMTINATAPILLALYVAAAESQGVRAGGHRGHDPERHPQGVHRPRHVHLPAPPVDAARDRRLRVLRRRAAEVEHDLDLGLPHARGGGDGGPGAGLHPGRRDRLRRGRRRPRPRRRRLRRAPVVLLRRLVGAVRGGRQVPGRPPDVGDDHARAVRGDQPALVGLPVPRPDRRARA